MSNDISQYKSLHDIGVMCKTDKANRHEYLDIYEKYISKYRNQPISLFEIGYKDGHSADMWEKYFVHADSKFYFLDFNTSKRVNSAKLPRTKLIYGNQSKRKNLLAFKPFSPFDIIIDDGGHKVSQQHISFGFLFPYVKSGGMYIIEDLFLGDHSPEVYNASGTEYTTTYMAKKLRDHKILQSDFILDTEARYIEQHACKCNIDKGRKSEICFITKR